MVFVISYTFKGVTLVKERGDAFFTMDVSKIVISYYRKYNNDYFT